MRESDSTQGRAPESVAALLRRGFAEMSRARSEATADDAATAFAVAVTRRMTKDGSARRIRERSGLSLREAGRVAGVGPVSVLRWETGQMVPRRADHAQRYGELLLRLADLTDLAEPPGGPDAA